VDKINKALNKLSPKDREKLQQAFLLVVLGQTQGLNIKKLKGHQHLYRLRVGNARLVYLHPQGQQPVVLFVGRRNDQTYRDF